MQPPLYTDERTCLLLQGTGLIRSNDVDEMRAAVARLFCEHRLKLCHPGGGMKAQMQARTLAEITVVQIEYGVPVVIEPRVMDDFYLFRVVLAGTAHVVLNGKTHYASPMTATLINPSQCTQILPSQDCRSLLLKLSRQKMEQLLCERLCYHLDQPLLFDPSVDLSRPGCARVWRYAQYLIHELVQIPEPSPIPPTLVPQLEQILMSMILQFLPSNYSHVLERSTPVLLPRHVRRAVSFMEAHFEQPLTLRRIADEANVSVRTLANGFRQFHGQTPMEYLRSTRLRRAHEMLSAGTDESVTSVALKVGIRHLGRFASLYKSHFGVMPSETLARS